MRLQEANPDRFAEVVGIVTSIVEAQEVLRACKRVRIPRPWRIDKRFSA